MKKLLLTLIGVFTIYFNNGDAVRFDTANIDFADDQTQVSLKEKNFVYLKFKDGSQAWFTQVKWVHNDASATLRLEIKNEN